MATHDKNLGSKGETLKFKFALQRYRLKNMMTSAKIQRVKVKKSVGSSSEEIESCQVLVSKKICDVVKLQNCRKRPTFFLRLFAFIFDVSSDV